MCHLYPYNDVKLLRKFFYINILYSSLDDISLCLIENALKAG